MGPGPTYALTAFLTGILCLLGWLYVTADDPRSTAILKKSLWLIFLPAILNPVPWLGLPLGMWLGILFEEAIKAFASTREQHPVRKFWLISLFGVWELMVGKPFWGLVIAGSGEEWDRLSLIGLSIATMIPVLMHAVTAAIYAFWLDGRLSVAIAVSWAIHAAFNGSVEYFGLSMPVQLTHIICLSVLFAVLLAKRPRPELTPSVRSSEDL